MSATASKAKGRKTDTGFKIYSVYNGKAVNQYATKLESRIHHKQKVRAVKTTFKGFSIHDDFSADIAETSDNSLFSFENGTLTINNAYTWVYNANADDCTNSKGSNVANAYGWVSLTFTDLEINGDGTVNFNMTFTTQSPTQINNADSVFDIPGLSLVLSQFLEYFESKTSNMYSASKMNVLLLNKFLWNLGKTGNIGGFPIVSQYAPDTNGCFPNAILYGNINSNLTAWNLHSIISYYAILKNIP